MLDRGGRHRWGLFLILLPFAALFAVPQATAETDQHPIEVAVTSTKSPLVTGGDARIDVRGLLDDDQLDVHLGDGRDVTDVFTRAGSIASGVVTGLALGDNDITATASGSAGTRSATLTIVNHPITGPIISGPHQVPFVCETEQSNLGPPLDEDCSAPTVVSWYAREANSGDFVQLADPYAPYPAGTATTKTRDGVTVPFVVRVESVTINRSITRIAVLDDPAARGPNAPYTPSAGWNGSGIYQFGESCGTGYHQGRNQVTNVLGSTGVDAENLAGLILSVPARLGEGYLYTHSTLTIFGVHCNQILSAETATMVKEHIIEAYGPLQQLLGVGASGGALQQYTIIDGYPGLLDAGVPILSFPDVVSTAMSVVDCGLLDRVFDTDPNRWNDVKRSAVSGFVTARICQDWVDFFLPNIRPTSCAGVIPKALRYDAVTNPGGARCTVQDSAVNLLGRDPATGFALRPVDNTGVQYGYRALQQNLISVRDFLDVNRDAGGYDIDGNWTPARMNMPEELAARVYTYGGVTGRGAPEETPIIDIRIYVDAVPILGFHDQRRPFLFSDRLAQQGFGASHAIWTGVPLPADALRIAHEWADAVDAIDTGDRAAAVAASAPPEGEDRCTAPSSVEVANIELGPVPLLDIPACPELLGLATGDTTRIAAGGPPTDDVIKCQLGPVERADYPPLTDAEFAELQAIFPTGVCDWTKPSVGFTPDSITWASVGGDTLVDAFQVVDVVARSSGTTTGAVAAGRTEADPEALTTLPATGGPMFPMWAPASLVVIALFLAHRRATHR